MANKPSNELFDLIKSMSKSEKRYFKVFGSRHITGEENKHMKLFDIIDRQSYYDEEKNLKNLSITKPQLKDWKNYLCKLILKSEENFYIENTAGNKIKHLIIHAEILFNKGLYDHCLKLLEKAKQLATQYEKHLLLIDILTWEETTFRRIYDIKELEKHIDNNFKKMEKRGIGILMRE